MKKANLIFFTLVLASSMLVGCSNNKSSSSSSEDGPIPGVLEKYTFDNTDYSTQEEQSVNSVRFYYHRNDNTDNSYKCYSLYRVYVWDPINGGSGKFFDFNMYNSFGVSRIINLSDITPSGDVTKIGFIITTETWTKDVDEDRFLDIKDKANGGVQRAYLRTKDSKIFDDQETAMKSTIKYARLSDDRKIWLILNPIEKMTFDPTAVTVTKNGSPINVSIEDKSGSSSCQAIITLPEDIDIKDIYKFSYKFDDKWTDTVDLLITDYFDSQTFIDKYTYEGNDLGVSFDNEDDVKLTTFKVWAPTSKSVKLRIYNTGDYILEKTPVLEQDMVYGEKGVWTAQVSGNQAGKYYTYVVTNAAGTNEVVDPYAKSAGMNGKRGMIVNFKALNAEVDGWSTDSIPEYGESAVDASIYEMHVRDMTINPNSGVSAAHRGTYLGLTETGTTYTKGDVTVSTGLDHLKELGVTHVQIQPTYDFSSIDESLPNEEMSEDNYNWGYDPQNYNCLEGSYSTDPSDGSVRVKEFKEMVMALHKAGIGITMDVVYNHTSSYSNSNFELLVPYYYHRTQKNGTAYNGSGCGNEMASDRSMCNKFIVDSCKFWMEEYHLSGFRFDLMGLLDNQTMIDVYQASREIYSNAMVYGEPWTGGTTPLAGTNDPTKLTSQKTIQSSLNQSYFAGAGNYVGAFNDIIRNAVRGDNNPGQGYVQTGSGSTTIVSGIKGLFSSSETAINPAQVLNYTACHDNYTLADQLIMTNKSNRVLADMNTQADSIIFASEGVPFIQEGEDFLRSKAYEEDGQTKYSHNSYNVGDFINNMDYELKADNKAVFETFKSMIAMRKATPELRLATREEINDKVTVTASGALISEKVTGLNSNGDVLVLHTANATSIALDADYEVVFDNINSANIGTTISGTITLSANNSVVLRKK